MTFQGFFTYLIITYQNPLQSTSNHSTIDNAHKKPAQNQKAFAKSSLIR